MPINIWIRKFSKNFSSFYWNTTRWLPRSMNFHSNETKVVQFGCKADRTLRSCFPMGDLSPDQRDHQTQHAVGSWFQDQEFYQNQQKCGPNLGLNSARRHSDNQVFEIFVESRMISSTLVTFLKWNIFVYRKLRQWFDQSFTKHQTIYLQEKSLSFFDLIINYFR